MRRSIAFLAFAFLIGFAYSQSCVRNDYPFRLPNTVIPERYFLHLFNFDLESRAYDGFVNITASIKNPTTCVIIHSKVAISQFNVTSHSGFVGDYVYTPVSLSYEADKQWVVASFTSVLLPGPYTISISFSGVMLAPSNTGVPAKGFTQSHTTLPIPKMKANSAIDLNTFHASVERLRVQHPEASQFEILGKYVEENMDIEMVGSGHGRLWATNFEPVHARSAFPVFDEPSFKAKWTFAIDIPTGENLTALFNTELDSVVVHPDEVTETWTFKETPVPMSPYLVCWAFGWLDYVETYQSGIRHRIYAPVGGSQYARTALGISARVIDAYGSFWKIPYQFNKLDQLVLPSMITSAMENWGLVTYGPTLLLLDALPTDIAKAIGGSVIAHELAHQWFGDLITCQWWNATYINEGFANWLQNAGLRAAAPQYQALLDASMSGFFGNSYTGGLNADITGANGPIIKRSTTSPNAEGSWDTPASAIYTFDRITYGKGAAINKMMQEYVGGESAWNNALSVYLSKFSFGNPSPDDLLYFLTQYNGNRAPVSQTFSPWLYQAGFPVISVEWNATGRVLDIAQEPISTVLIDPSTKWTIPLTLTVLYRNGTSVAGGQYKTELSTAGRSVNLPYWPTPFDSLVLVNMNHSTYAVVDYGEAFPDVFNAIIGNSNPLIRALHLTDLALTIVTNRNPVDLLFPVIDIMAKNIYDTQGWTVLLNQLKATYLPVFNNPPFLDDVAGTLSQVRDVVGYTFKNVPALDAIRADLMFVSAWADAEDMSEYCAWAVYNHTALGMPIETSIRQACYVSAVRTSEDLYELLFTTVATNSSSFDAADLTAMAYSLMAVPDPNTCMKSINAVVPNPTVNLPLLADMIKFNGECRDAAWAFYSSNAEAYLSANGWNWKNFLAPVYVLSSSEHYDQATQLMDQLKAYIPWQARMDVLATIVLHMDS